MSRVDSQKAPAKFQDVAAYFSEEEWKLLHEWQEELYSNVMKEIQQALTSLGPLIATSVFSLRCKENEVCPMDNPEPERICSIKSIKRSKRVSDMRCGSTFRMEVLESSHNDTEEEEPSSDPVSGHSTKEQIISFSIKKERGAHSKVSVGSEKSMDANSPQGAVNSVNDVPETRFMDHIYIEDRESTTNLNSDEHAVMPPVSFTPKNEGKPCCMDLDHGRSESKEIVCNFTGVNTSTNFIGPHQVSRLEKMQNNIDCESNFNHKLDNTSPLIMHSGDKAFPFPDYGNSFNQSYNSVKNKENQSGHRTDSWTDCGDTFSEPANLDAFENIHTEMKVCICKQCGICFNLPKNMIAQNDAEQSKTCWECQKSFLQSANLCKEGQDVRGGPYICNECGKSFRQPRTLIAHQQVHTAEKHYVCDECGKGFRQLQALTEHQKTHTGERSYICNECGITYQQLQALLAHQRIHAGERPFICSECGKSFAKKQALVIHQRIHTGEKPHSCTICGKNFRQLPHLITHQRMHTGEKPCKCNICEKRFFDSSTLKRHQQIHTRGNP